jgi:hypothetical protein
MTIIQLETKIGIIPVASSREIFDLSKLEKDKIIVMFADVKINLE